MTRRWINALRETNRRMWLKWQKQQKALVMRVTPSSMPSEQSYKTFNARK